MGLRNVPVVRATFTLVVVAVLAGCSGAGAPSQSPSPAGTPSTDPAPALGPAAIVEISADAVTVLDESGTEIGSHDYLAGVDGLVTLLEDAFGTAPVVTPAGPESCSTDTVYVWGDDNAVSVAESTEPKPAPFAPVTVSVKVAELGGVDIVSSTGFSVGDDVSDVIDALPPERVNDAIQIIWELSATADASSGVPFGGWAFVDYDTRRAIGIGAPGVLGSGYC